MSRLAPVKPVVLVVEDQPVLRMSAVDLVECLGFEAVEACDADDAVRILESRLDIRVVFADLDMPGGFDGMKLAAAIRRRWPPVEIIMTSVKRRPRSEDMPTRGVFFPKPYRPAEVAEAMQRMAR